MRHTAGLPHKPDPFEGALLALRLIEAKEQEDNHQKLTRFRVSETTLKRLWCRKRIPLDYLLEVQEWLIDAGWALVFAGSTYAMIKVSSVESWTRLGSKRVATEIELVSRGKYDFSQLRHLIADKELGAEVEQ
jgi:hypothetical protein